MYRKTPDNVVKDYMSGVFNMYTYVWLITKGKMGVRCIHDDGLGVVDAS